MTIKARLGAVCCGFVAGAAVAGPRGTAAGGRRPAREHAGHAGHHGRFVAEHTADGILDVGEMFFPIVRGG